jgi:flagellar basal-body rod modification protein FlgD
MYVSGSTETVFSPSQEKQSFLGKEDFFKLLTLQLQHQNFFNPQDNNEFMAQVMDMTIVAQLTNLNDRLSCFFEMEKQFQTITLLDQTVEVTKHDGTKAQGLVTGVRFTAEGPLLNVDGRDYSLAQVTQIRVQDGVNHHE